MTTPPNLDQAGGEQFVTVARFLEPVNAQMAKGLLDSAGIHCFLQGENANSMMAFAFRVRLQVRQLDETAAMELLASSVDSLGDQWDTNVEGRFDDGR